MQAAIATCDSAKILLLAVVEVAAGFSGSFMKGGFSPQAPSEFDLLSWNGDSLELLAPGGLPAKARLVYDANMQSDPLFTKPVDRQLLHLTPLTLDP